MIPVLYPDMPKLDSVLPYLERVHNSGLFTNFGPLNSELKANYAKLLNVDVSQIESAANATLGIQGALRILGGNSWAIQDWSFPATGLAAQNANVEYTFLDVSPDSWRVDFTSLADENAGGILAVEPFGVPLDLSWYEPIETLVLDAAASLGNLPDLSKIKPNWIIVFSLHATKILGCGEGALLVFGSAENANKFRFWSNFGFSGTRISQIERSTNAKLSEVGAGYALASLGEFPRKVEKYLTLRNYINSFSSSLGILPKPLGGTFVSPYWIVKFPNRSIRDFVESSLNDLQIQTRRWWPNLMSRMPAFVSPSRIDSHSRVSSELLDITLGLPFHLKLEFSDIEIISESIMRYTQET